MPAVNLLIASSYQRLDTLSVKKSPFVNTEMLDAIKLWSQAEEKFVYEFAIFTKKLMLKNITQPSNIEQKLSLKIYQTR